MRIARGAYEELIAHAREAKPKECCGMLAAVDGVVVAVHRARNAKDSHLAYAIDGLEQMRIYDAIDEAGQEYAAVYHSHPRTEARPSQADINAARNVQDHVLVGLSDDDEPEVRSFSIVGRQVTEHEVVVLD